MGTGSMLDWKRNGRLTSFCKTTGKMFFSKVWAIDEKKSSG
jgi:hypothetical protein